MNQNISQNDNRDKELKALESQLRDKELLYRSDVSSWLKQAYLCKNPRIYTSLINRLRLVLDEYKTEVMRTGGVFMPHCPEALSEGGELHLLNQIDGVRICIDPDKLVTGMLVIGPSGGGKSMFLVHLCEELLRVQ